MQLDWIEWFGYIASMVVLISLTMSSIIKLRVINLIGSLLFASFAYFIDSYPTMFMNLCIALINVYYLSQMHRSKEQFKMISASTNSEYFHHFITVNQQEIEKQIDLTELKKAEVNLYMLRNNNIVGVLSGTLDKSGVFTVFLDYVVPRYRDFKLGNYFYNHHPEFIKSKGINTLKTRSNTASHQVYLKKMGFKKQIEGNIHTYIKRL